MATRIGVLGVGGRMGRLLVAEIGRATGAALAGGTVKRESPLYGQDVGRLSGLEPLGMPATDDPATLLGRADVVIDFTSPAALAPHLAAAVAAGKALVLGTSGLSRAEEEAVADAARSIPIVYAANFAPAVNVMLGLVRQAAAALGPDYDIEIVEMHHRQKVDAPSGTAIALGREAAAGRGVDLEAVMESGRHGHTGRRADGAIGFATLRGGQVVGEHSVIFAGGVEHITIGHRSFDRRIYAEGAVRAALWAAGRPPGLHGMLDVLGMAR
ncbi:4-hydroxy-tetrahydrodipicolinate reductase [Elioraea sp.]|uniref:4-hydroxy-tetrahydrodipicolinate reductase n=1 Tax=Elioraea sp. TaxID=2185103 RepID=UPI0025B8842C|nr:4-hydroxy-tetrahydrodipicolinate reductase [Elioraea sp.]